MTETQVDNRNENEGTAVEAGSKATERFTASGKLSELDVPKERVSLLAGALIKAANDIVVEHQVTYEEYNALKAWLIKVGTDGEWPLFLDVWLEHTVEDVNSQDRPGTKGTIEGPYYVPGSPVLRLRPPSTCATAKRAPRCASAAVHRHRRQRPPECPGGDLAR